MITTETVSAALKGTDIRIHSGTCWFTNGHFALRGEQWVGLATELRERIAPVIARWQECKTIPVLEAVELRIDPVIRNEKCNGCSLGQVKHEDCDDCTGHVCDECGGTGRLDVVKDVGQRVYVGAGGDTVVKPQYGALLEGLTVAREADGDPAKAMVFGFDDTGALVVVVMPFFADVRR